jgi:MinD-like ATPase involved in chromosome partitioning or flagellar assembly
MRDRPTGQVVTFYSYKGGTGRTMALANVAWILAANGKRVLAIDWDLESPGLHRYFAPFLDPASLANTPGVIDLIREYEWAAANDPSPHPDRHERHARLGGVASPLDWAHFPDGGALHFMSAGRQNRDYVPTLSGLDWDAFYERLDGGRFFDALRTEMKRDYDYTLIDSRTGFSDVADICTIHLPDILVDCFTYTEQGIDGAAAVARSVGADHRGRDIRILPVPMRVELAEKQKMDTARSVAMRRFGGLPVGLTDEQRARYWARVSVPYVAYYAYEETLATFGDLPGSGSTTLAAYEALTSHITDGEVRSLPPVDEILRQRVLVRFERRAIVEDVTVSLRYRPEDQVWGEWITAVLLNAGVRVHDRYATAQPTPPDARPLLLLSHRADLDAPDSADDDRQLCVVLSDHARRPALPTSQIASIFAQPGDRAIDRILTLVGRPDAHIDRVDLPPFPGREPGLFQAPPRNPRFTGRDDDIRELRARLRQTAPGSGDPVVLHGLGGSGKTQIAIEYAHRFRSAYDIIWWIAADPPSLIAGQAAEFAEALGVGRSTGGRDTFAAAFNALRRSDPRRPSLLIFDNAEDVEAVSDFLPRHGHVLLTSRNATWTDRVTTVPVDVFAREHSVGFLRQRVPSLSPEDADVVAELVADLPTAVATAGAWLAETGMSVTGYVNRFEAADAVQDTFDLPLRQLADRSPGAHRLLQLCSVCAPTIALDIIYSDAMATALLAHDPHLSDRLARGSLVQHLNRLALAKLDNQTHTITIHPLLQAFVRNRMTDAELTDARRHVHRVLVAARPRLDVDEPTSWPRYRTIWPHLEPSAAADSADETVRTLLIDQIRYGRLRGDLERTGELAARIDARWSSSLAGLTGPAGDSLRRQLTQLRYNAAGVLRDRGQFEAARTIDAQVATEQAELLGNKHRLTLLSRGGLAADLRALGRFAEARVLAGEVFASWREQVGEDHPRTLAAMGEFATSLRLDGRSREALALDEEAYAHCRSILGQQHPDTIAAAARRGRDMRALGEYERSVVLLRTVVAWHTDTLDVSSPPGVVATTDLAVSLQAAGRADEASAMFAAVAQRLDDLPAQSPGALACRHARALYLTAPDEGEAELAAVTDVYRRQLGDTHPTTLSCLNNRAIATRDPDRAHELAATARRALATSIGATHPLALVAAMNIGVIMAERGDDSAARDALRAAADGLAEVLGPDHPDALCAAANLGRADDGDTAAALIRLAARLGPDHPTVVALRQGRYLRRTIDPYATAY